MPNYTFEHISGYFEHDTQPIGPNDGFRAKTLPKLGLLNNITWPATVEGATEWQKLLSWLDTVNKEDNESSYKLLIVSRHGEGVHNVKEREVGRHAWEQNESRVDGDEKSTWADARLTSKGELDARAIGQFFRDDLEHEGVDIPTTFHSSSLTRSIQTAVFAAQAASQENKNIVVQVDEQLRETVGVHTCDRRSKRSVLEKEFFTVRFSQSITEDDELWKPDHRETEEQITKRLHSWLETLFDQDPSHVVAVFSHSGAIRALHRVVGHPDVWPAAGSANPVLVRAKKV